MAQLTNTELETHPSGSAGLNSIVNGNWTRLEEIFNPATGSGDSAYQLFGKALLRDALSSMANGEAIVWSGSKFTRRAPVNTLVYAATTDLDFESGAAAPVQILALTGDVTLTTSNLAAGKEMKVIMTEDDTGRSLTFPAGWTFVGGTAPGTLPTGKTAVLKLISTSAADSGVVAEWAVES